MADITKATDGVQPDESAAFDFTKLPDYDNDFVDDDGIVEFAKALAAPEPSPSQDDLTNPTQVQSSSLFITALNDWRPVRQRVRRKARKARRGKDETREGYVYALLKWPLLFTVFGWIVFLAVSYLLTRFYIYLYEHWVTWRGKRERLRKKLNTRTSYEDWVGAARELDTFLGNDKWKKTDDYAYYDSKTVRRVRNHLKEYRQKAEDEEHDQTTAANGAARKPKAVKELRNLLEACVKNNFVGYENPRVYSETYYGTKNLIQDFVDEAEASLSFILHTEQLSREEKREFFKRLHTNFGRTAFCLSGGATFAYYHFGVAKALLDADLLPEVITGTSGGALVAALLATRTTDELKQLLVPALAHRITACHEGTWAWMKRWYQTGARFDSIDWACRTAWFTRGSTTFREAYIRTGRILNVSCVPSDPHSPTILANYLTSPDCVIWSAVLASAAVPGILNPIVLMKKVKYVDPKDGSEKERLEPYSFGHKWKDGSLRTDIPLRALNLHFNVNFSIVSQVNPHVNLFFFSSRGSVGRPVTHRKGRGWRGGYMGSAIEQYLKLDMTKWLKVLRHLELLPRPMGQDWSEIWLQKFSGTITIWPKSIPSDFYHILSDPTPQRLARMIHVGQLSTWPKLKFIGNRMKLEKLIELGRRTTRPIRGRGEGGIEGILSEDDLRGLLNEAQRKNIRADLLGVDGSRDQPAPPMTSYPPSDSDDESAIEVAAPNRDKPLPVSPPERLDSSSLSTKLSGLWRSISPSASRFPGSPLRQSSNSKDGSNKPLPSALNPTAKQVYTHHRPMSMFELRPETPRTKQQNWEEEQRKWEAFHAYQEAQKHRRSSLVDELSRQSLVFFDDEDFNRDTDGTGEEETDDEGAVDDLDVEHGDVEVARVDEDELAKAEEKIWDGQDEGRARRRKRSPKKK